MLDEAVIEELNRGYVCPPDAGPAWREAFEYGFDMSLVEDALRQTPDQRLREHQRALDMMLELNPKLGTDAALGSGVGIAAVLKLNPDFAPGSASADAPAEPSALELRPGPETYATE